MAREIKESGVSWIGKVPSSWKVVPIKVAFSEIKTKNTDGAITNALKFKFGEIVSKANFDSETDDYVADTILNYTIVEPRTIMINGLNLNYDFKTLRTGLVKEKGVITSAYLALKPDENMVCAEYATYLFKGYESKMAFHNMGSGIRLTLGFKEFKNQPLLLPMLQEQKAIADFLDKQCAEIDAVIAKTKATIEEYKKLKQSIITEAVTKGIRGERPMKDRGIELIGDIPSDWKCCKLKYIIDTVNSGIGLSNEKLSDNGTYPVYGGGNLIGYYDDYNLENTLIIGRVGARCGCITKISGKAWATDNALIVKTKQNIDWLFYVLTALDLNKLNTSNAQPLITGGKILNSSIPVCSDETKCDIVEYLNEKCSKIDTLIENKTALLEEMESYKKSVIYEYVTGKKECKNNVAEEKVVAIYPYFPAVLNTDKARFAQAVLMSKILDSNVSNMGRVKLEKMLFTIEHSLGFDFGTEYHREAAGPLDSSIYKCEKVISRANKWFYVNSSKYGTSYKPQKDMEKYKKYYEQYFSEYNEEIERIISIFKTYSLDQSEIVATLYGAWNDFIIDKKSFTDEDIVTEVLTNWNESKKRFSKDVWLRAIENMRQNNLVPKGYGRHTIIKEVEQ